MKELKYFDIIVKYANNELSVDKREAFEQELLINTALYEEYELYKRVVDKLEDKDLMEFYMAMQEVSKSHVKRNNFFGKKLSGSVNRKVLLYLIIVASFIILLWFYFGFRWAF
ncbi:MAG: hypothetical protein WC341_12400 [Bacteroidales bacterium]|jgi:preprotein translocase subunit SecF